MTAREFFTAHADDGRAYLTGRYRPGRGSFYLDAEAWLCELDGGLVLCRDALKPVVRKVGENEEVDVSTMVGRENARLVSDSVQL
jgi:hypothetical protein